MSWGEFSRDYAVICRRLQEAKRNGRMGQAYLLMGDDAKFLEAFAMKWAEIAACQQPLADGSNCGQCPNCCAFERQAYPELLTLRPQSKSRLITVDAMREFERQISLSTREGMLKIGIIVEAECLGEEAQNAFLKTLEEPPDQTMLLLLTVNSRKLLPTIRSRCQLVSLLRNRTDYSLALDKELYTKLQPLHRQAGATIGMKGSTELLKLFSSLHKEAEGKADELRDHRWDAIDNPKMKKQLEDDVVARVEAEYVRMRDSLLDAIVSWYLQRFLVASGVRPELLPHQEMLPFLAETLSAPPPAHEAERDITLAEELVQCIKANVDEHLALDSFCLSVTEKSRRQ